MAVVLLSVDPGYFGEDGDYRTKAKSILKKNKIEWPSAFLPGGWDDSVRTFNVSGYGPIVIDAQGIVRGVNIHGAQLDDLVRTLPKAANREQPAP